MILTGDTVTFKSSDEWYGLERSGEKPATVRIMTDQEAADLFQANPSLIVIRHADTGASFTRRVRSVYAISSVFGDRLAAGESAVMVSWEHALTLSER